MLLLTLQENNIIMIYPICVRKHTPAFGHCKKGTVLFSSDYLKNSMGTNAIFIWHPTNMEYVYCRKHRSSLLLISPKGIYVTPVTSVFCPKPER